MTTDAYLAAEARSRVEIDRQLVACGWDVQSRGQMNLYADPGVAVREFIMATGLTDGFEPSLDGKPIARR